MAVWIWEIRSHRMPAVSYTHLDVYKRQDESCAEGMELLRMAAAGDSGFTLEKIKAIEQKLSLIHI